MMVQVLLKQNTSGSVGEQALRTSGKVFLCRRQVGQLPNLLALFEAMGWRIVNVFILTNCVKGN
jgi:hypothetical protein